MTSDVPETIGEIEVTVKVNGELTWNQIWGFVDNADPMHKVPECLQLLSEVYEKWMKHGCPEINKTFSKSDIEEGGKQNEV